MVGLLPDNVKLLRYCTAGEERTINEVPQDFSFSFDRVNSKITLGQVCTLEVMANFVETDLLTTGSIVIFDTFAAICQIA